MKRFLRLLGILIKAIFWDLPIWLFTDGKKVLMTLLIICVAIFSALIIFSLFFKNDLKPEEEKVKKDPYGGYGFGDKIEVEEKTEPYGGYGFGGEIKNKDPYGGYRFSD